MASQKSDVAQQATEAEQALDIAECPVLHVDAQNHSTGTRNNGCPNGHPVSGDAHTHQVAAAIPKAVGKAVKLQKWSQRSKYRLNLRKAQNARDGASRLYVGRVDPALIFSMERTFLSAFNQSFYLMMLATGLMAINDYDQVCCVCRARSR